MSELSLGQIKGLTVNSNIVTVPSGHTLYAPGHVIQVVHATTSTGVTVTTSTFTDTTLTATITPKLATSKIFVVVSQYAAWYRSGETSGHHLRLMRDATVLSGSGDGRSDFAYLAGLSAIEVSNIHPFTVLDAPNSTSPIVYKTQGSVNIGAGNSVIYQKNGVNPSTITLMEIAA